VKEDNSKRSGLPRVAMIDWAEKATEREESDENEKSEQ